MSKKKFLVTILLMFSLVFTALIGCTVTGTSSSDDSIESYQSEEVFSSESLETGSIEESEVESEIESETESETQSQVQISTPPTFDFTVSSTETTISFEFEENDPYNVGEITAIELILGKEKIVAEDMSTRSFDGLYSGEQYVLSVTYTYDIGDGPVPETKKKTKRTMAIRKPTIDISYTPVSDDSFSFELDVTDVSNVCEITAIKLFAENGEEVASLTDLTQRVFEGIPSEQYTLVVYYQYDLNKGDGIVTAEQSATVATVISPLIIPDFIVEVEEGRNPVILQISDTQIIDAKQARPGDTGTSSYYNPEKMEERLFKFLRETVNATRPDLILITGDLVYGQYDDKGTSLLALINIMDSFQIPWAPVLGNHDPESRMGVDWQCQQLENAEYCLFKQRKLSGNGNYTVGIAQGGKLTRVFFMMDTNGCGNPSPESLANGHTYNNFVGFKDDQVNWFMEVGTQIKEISPDTKFSFAFHIQIYEFNNAFSKYGFTDSG
ncbi:MAG: metallophosphoesterase, partial [Clostridia bacterium]|nr:metallophosphoesterase [Clostridia bacterium]